MTLIIFIEKLGNNKKQKRKGKAIPWSEVTSEKNWEYILPDVFLYMYY